VLVLFLEPPGLPHFLTTTRLVVLVLFLEPAGLPHFLTMTRRKGVNLTKKGVNEKNSKNNLHFSMQNKKDAHTQMR